MPVLPIPRGIRSRSRSTLEKFVHSIRDKCQFLAGVSLAPPTRPPPPKPPWCLIYSGMPALTGKISVIRSINSLLNVTPLDDPREVSYLKRCQRRRMLCGQKFPTISTAGCLLQKTAICPWSMAGRAGNGHTPQKFSEVFPARLFDFA